MTIGEAILAMTKAVGVTPWKGTVDTLKCGRPNDPVRGIVTTFMPTYAVIQAAAKLGANLVVTHEPLWYNHLDDTKWLRGDPVYAKKKRLLDRHRIAVYRTHDTWHARKPDGILEGQMERLDWARFQRPAGSRFLAFPRWSVRRIVESAKRGLGIGAVRLVGDPGMVPRRVAYHCGWSGARAHIDDLKRPGVEAVVCGEGFEWESYEWVRDAARQGRRAALIVLGHEPSEEAGMEHLARWLDGRFPGVPVWFVAAGSSFKLL